ncbi:MAG TPA: LssY C-terminal domain-containing protein [Xanthomonadales bacterium]|nr:LssY C-terminal domain-containing protein [Xanthomonadales bacterium]
MKQLSTRVLCAPAVILFSLLLAACSAAAYRHESLDNFDVRQRAVTQQHGAIRVSASVPGKEEAERIFGFPIYDRGIQPVWLELTNHSDSRARVALTSIDPEYFAPLEVAYMHKKRFSKQGWLDMEQYLHGSALPRQIGPGQTVSGFVFTHAVTGTKAFNLDVYSSKAASGFEQFTFFVEVPGFVPDHKDIDFENLYAPDVIRDVDNDGLRALLAEIPCCTANHDGSQQGRPVALFLVAEGRDLLGALLRAGWSETSYVRDPEYLASADYLFGRPPDSIFRKRRDNSTDRAELGLWLAPASVAGKPLWVAQYKHAIGRRYAIGEFFFGITLDPDTIEGRNFVLQDFWYAQSLQHWAWSKTGRQVLRDDLQLDFHGNPWFSSEDYRVVIWVSGEPIALSAASEIGWGRHEVIAGQQP